MYTHVNVCLYASLNSCQDSISLYNYAILVVNFITGSCDVNRPNHLGVIRQTWQSHINPFVCYYKRLLGVGCELMVTDIVSHHQLLCTVASFCSELTPSEAAPTFAHRKQNQPCYSAPAILSHVHLLSPCLSQMS